MLHDALLALLRERPFEEIDIQMITDRADTARVTFYRHYGTKEELLLDVIEGIYEAMQGTLADVSIEHVMNFRLDPPEQILFTFLEQDRQLYKQLFGGTISALIVQRLRHFIVQQVYLTFSNAPQYADLPIGLMANHMASCLIGNVLWWLLEDVPYSAATVARLSHWMSLSGAFMLVGRADELAMPPPDAWRTLI